MPESVELTASPTPQLESVAASRGGPPLAQTGAREVFLLDNPAPAPSLQTRVRSWPLRSLSFLIVVIAPTLFGALYLGFFASSSYTSEFRVTVRSAEPVQMAGFSALLGLGSMSQSSQSANAIVQYLQSRKAVEDLNRNIGIREMFSRSSLDYLSRLRPDAEAEQVVRYWQRMLSAFFETATATITVRVSAFTPQDAYAIAVNCVKLSEDLVNEMSERSRRDTVSIAENGVRKAQGELQTANGKMRELRDRFNIIDPKITAETISRLINTLRGELVSKRVNVEVMQRSLASDAPSLREAQAQVKAIENQLAQLGGETTQNNEPRTQTLSSAMSSFEQAMSEVDFATKYYETELASLKQAELEASRQQLYLSTIVPPEPPQEAAFPRPISGTFKIFLVAIAVWTIGSLAVAAVREHL